MSSKPTTTLVKQVYDDQTVRHFLLATVFWGVVAMLVGVLAAFQLNFPDLNGKFFEVFTAGAFKSEGVSWLTFGRLRPLHTNAAIFAFVGNMMFAGIYFSTQRLCRIPTASKLLSKIHFWGWQLIILAAALTLPLGYSRGKEYAELIWPINIMVVVIWVVFAINFFWTLAKRQEKSLYVALWFYIATIITVAMLYIVNHLSIPTSWTHSYPIFAGVQDALVQWWYGHNAVAFFLTTPILGIMYYFMPKAAERPVYSYRLSIVHFWSLVFVYIWAGPHHLLNTALPVWLQTLGVTFSLMLWAPSWGGMLNGLLTLRGAWDKLRTDPVLKFFAAAVTFYGMATFEGPLLSIRAVNSLSHYSDWTIGHVHMGTLGWNGFMAAGMVYWLLPRLWDKPLHSKSLADLHFWIGMAGILLYVAAMWVSGVTQGLMLNATTADGLALAHPNFLETQMSVRNLMLLRAVGGALYLIGFLLLAYNMIRTIWGAKATTTEIMVEQRILENSVEKGSRLGWVETFRNDPVAHFLMALIFLGLGLLLPNYANVMGFVSAAILTWRGIDMYRKNPESWVSWHERLLKSWAPFSILTFIAVAIGGAVQLLPGVVLHRAKNVEDRLQKVYTPLELAGRDIYVSEGCYNCHSQMIRTLVPDVLRYGPKAEEGYNRLGESIYDHPFQWGSKRTGPDLAREGGKRNHLWHYDHMRNPRLLFENSNMPAYPWLLTTDTDFKSLPRKIAVQQKLGVPFAAMSKDEIEQSARDQALNIAKELVALNAQEAPSRKDGEAAAKSAEEFAARLSERQIVALIAYLQKLGSYDSVPALKEAELKTAQK